MDRPTDGRTYPTEKCTDASKNHQLAVRETSKTGRLPFIPSYLITGFWRTWISNTDDNQTISYICIVAPIYQNSLDSKKRFWSRSYRVRFAHVGVDIRSGKDVGGRHRAEMKRHVEEDEEEDFLSEDGKIHGAATKPETRRHFRRLCGGKGCKLNFYSSRSC